jgi:hypothetical protein
LLFSLISFKILIFFNKKGHVTKPTPLSLFTIDICKWWLTCAGKWPPMNEWLDGDCFWTSKLSSWLTRVIILFLLLLQSIPKSSQSVYSKGQIAYNMQDVDTNMQGGQWCNVIEIVLEMVSDLLCWWWWKADSGAMWLDRL